MICSSVVPILLRPGGSMPPLFPDDIRTNHDASQRSLSSEERGPRRGERAWKTQGQHLDSESPKGHSSGSPHWVPSMRGIYCEASCRLKEHRAGARQHRLCLPTSGALN